MHTLYYSPGTASMAAHMALIEIAAPFRLERVDFGQQAQRSEEYLRLNPMGQVPTLVIDGQPYTESAALLMMLADRHPDAGLAPLPGTPGRNQMYQWLVVLSNALGANFRNWFYPDDLGEAEHPPAVKAALQARIEGVWTLIDNHLAAHGPYLLGEQLSLADFQLIMYMRWSRNMPRSALSWPALQQFATLLRSRESWQRLCDVENLTEWRG